MEVKPQWKRRLIILATGIPMFFVYFIAGIHSGLKEYMTEFFEDGKLAWNWKDENDSHSS